MGVASRQEGVPGKNSHQLALLALEFVEFGRELTFENFFFQGKPGMGGKGVGKLRYCDICDVFMNESRKMCELAES